jgi:two-component system, NtrC family, response regulator PilR
MAKILMVDDEDSIREFFDIMLTKEGYSVTCVSSGAEALKKMEETIYDVMITDISMPQMTGLELLHKAKEITPETNVIMITAYASTESAVEAMKNGAYDYILKPFKLDEIKLIIRKALEQSYLSKENALLKKEIRERYGFGKLIGKSISMLKVYELIEAVSGNKSSVLITGESGTGKELVAKAIHYNSPRKDGPFVSINCGAIPENLIESELFGYIKGSFTGATNNKKGLFEIADRGTFFLDEIGELPLHVQVKLLRVLQEKTIRRIGGTEDVSIDVRIISATNKDLEAEIKGMKFREDLFYRLNVIEVKLPSLRERRDDIPLLVYHFLNHFAQEHHKVVKGISREALDLLARYDYPGNVRELENIVERAVALETDDLIQPQNISIKVDPKDDAALKEQQLFPYTLSEKAQELSSGLASGKLDLERELERIERRVIMEALKSSGGSKQKAAKMLNLSFRSLRYRVSKLGLDKEYDFGNSSDNDGENGKKYQESLGSSAKK